MRVDDAASKSDRGYLGTADSLGLSDKMQMKMIEVLLHSSRLNGFGAFHRVYELLWSEQ